MATSSTFKNELLAKFQAAYWAAPQSPFSLAYSNALLSTDASTRDAEIDTVMKEFGYDSLTGSQINRITNTDNLSPVPAASVAPNSTPAKSSSPIPTSPPITTPDTTGASAYIFLAFTGSYNVTSDGFPDSTNEVIVNTAGTLDLGTSQPPLKPEVLIDDQNKNWVQWEVKPDSEWYIVTFSSTVDTKLGSTFREMDGFRCVVDSGGKQTNTPISAQCPTLKPKIGNSLSEFMAFLQQPYTWAGLSFAGAVMLCLNRYKHKTESHEASEKEKAVYQERLGVINDIARKGADIAAKDSISEATPAERMELHNRMRQSVKNIVQEFYDKPANRTADFNAATTALSQECKKAAADALRGWSNEVVVAGNCSDLSKYVTSYMDEHNLMAPEDREKTSAIFLEAIDHRAMKAYKGATKASGSPEAAFDAVADKYLKLALINHQLEGLGSKLQTSTGNIATAEAELNMARLDLRRKQQTSQDTHTAWQNLVDQVREATASKQNTTELEEQERQARAAYNIAEVSEDEAQKHVSTQETAHKKAMDDETRWKSEQEKGEEERNKLEGETQNTENGVMKHLGGGEEGGRE
ncbi:hypothetical protein NOF04DRAFT_17863 [Fusarium oxysporum II5]|nr:uncharacterized protein FOIG_15383 [Fusarium odoratissimum NRRL 54006]EXL91483.1 hypothetical protein FOIG_15383 [Fusarium odoratissimum NRRL 54006]KAK2124394.1 hypothetical protein NOF04DRAFT_17863 [Fusarium oxysporum II5]TXC02874.1 hypothetical protein FocTR4_00014757 [Fusarium oxysporum f. sp. cubense]